MTPFSYVFIAEFERIPNHSAKLSKLFLLWVFENFSEIKINFIDLLKITWVYEIRLLLNFLSFRNFCGNDARNKSWYTVNDRLSTLGNYLKFHRKTPVLEQKMSVGKKCQGLRNVSFSENLLYILNEWRQRRSKLTKFSKTARVCRWCFRRNIAKLFRTGFLKNRSGSHFLFFWACS